MVLLWSYVEDVYEHNHCITYTCQDMYHFLHTCTLWLQGVRTHCASEVFFFFVFVVLAFDFEYSTVS